MNTHFFPKSLDKPYIGIIHRNRLIRGWKKGKVVEDKKTARSCFLGEAPSPMLARAPLPLSRLVLTNSQDMSGTSIAGAKVGF